jgi:hypothetical protein
MCEQDTGPENIRELLTQAGGEYALMLAEEGKKRHIQRPSRLSYRRRKMMMHSRLHHRYQMVIRTNLHACGACSPYATAARDLSIFPCPMFRLGGYISQPVRIAYFSLGATHESAHLPPPV